MSYRLKLIILFALILLTATASFGQAQVGDFGGPSILSRGGAYPGERGGQPLSLQVFGGITGNVTTNAIASDSGASQDLFGIAGNIGAVGSRTFEHTYVGLDYSGMFVRYDHGPTQNTTEQALALMIDRQLARHITLDIRETASISNLAAGGLDTYSFYNSGLVGIPVNNIFNDRVYSSQTSAQVMWKPTARTVYSFFGDFFAVHRTSQFLVGVRGYRAGASVAWNLTRMTSVGVGYDFNHYSFPRAFGASDLHGVQVTLNHRFSRAWAAGLGIGGYRVETLGLATVALPPDIAEILGRSTGVQAVYRISYSPNFTGNLSYQLRRSNFTASAADTVSPGNGIYLTSRTQTASVGYGYSGLRRLSFSANFGYARYVSLYQNIGNYGSWVGGFGGGYRFTDHLNLVANYSLRQFQITNGGSNQFGQSASLGIFWTPYRLPVPSL